MSGGPVFAPGPHLGRIISFDRRRGLGTVVLADGAGVEVSFHATAIADGSRDIAIDSVVSFLVTPGLQGHYEARGLSIVNDSHQRPT
jgi:hypothetical protein